jgi:hypothetical protein
VNELRNTYIALLTALGWYVGMDEVNDIVLDVHDDSGCVMAERVFRGVGGASYFIDDAGVKFDQRWSEVDVLRHVFRIGMADGQLDNVVSWAIRGRNAELRPDPILDPEPEWDGTYHHA